MGDEVAVVRARAVSAARRVVRACLLASTAVVAAHAQAPAGPVGSAPAPAGSAPAQSGSAPAPRPELPALPPRAPVAGIAALQTTSSVQFTSAPDVRHTLTTAYAFPARARMHLVRSGDAENAREIRYERGNQVFTLAAGESASRELTGGERLTVRRDFAVRRAAYLWPDGVVWERSAGRATATLADGLGALTARLDAQTGRPLAIELADAQGAVVVALQALTWVEDKGRAWPSSCEGWRAGKLEWRETIDERAVNPTLLDAFFAPPDLRDVSAERERVLGVVRSEELPAFASRRTELPAGATWEQALARIAELEQTCTRELALLGLTLDSNRTVEVSDALAPVAVHLRLTKAPATLPAGFATVPARSGRLMFVEGLAAATVARLGELRRAVPAGANTQTPYLRIARQGDRVLLVLPLAPAN
jgi:hypothetical protein